jgi:hypothetical protein
MASFVLVPGAGGMASYWDPVVPLLEQGGHAATAVDLPGDDERAGLDAYRDLVGREGARRRGRARRLQRHVRGGDVLLARRAARGAGESAAAVTCGDGVTGWVEHALRLAGAETPRVEHVRCRFQGAPECVSDVAW